MKWKIWYDDNSTFSSEQGLPHEAPAFGVLAVATEDDRLGSAVLRQSDWYFYSEHLGGWEGADLFGILDQVMHHCDTVKAVIQGRVTTSKYFDKVVAQARNDPEMPRKSADSEEEVRGGRRVQGIRD